VFDTKVVYIHTRLAVNAVLKRSARIRRLVTKRILPFVLEHKYEAIL